MDNSTRAALADQHATSATNPRFTLAAYLAAGVGLAGLAPAADAAIVTIDITNPNVSGPNGGVGNGGFSVIGNWVPGASLSLFNGYGGGNLSGLSGSLDFATSTYYYASPQNLAFGSTIDGSLSFAASNGVTFFNIFNYYYGGQGNTYTSPDFGSGSYMGFVFGNGLTNNYGWIEITWSGSTNTWEILAAAYESQANTAILAGDVGSVSAPAPSPASLLALIVGGAALRQWRQRRRSTQPVATACT
jgi:hypothetical protein